MLAQCRTHGRRGVGLPSLDLQFDQAGDLLLGRHCSSFVVAGLVLLDLAEAEFHRRLAAEDLNQAVTFWASRLISLIVACNVANSPSITVTESPTPKSTSVTLSGAG